MNNFKVDIGNFTAERQSNGTFLYKSKNQNNLVLTKPQKKSGKDKPQFKVIEETELELKNQGKQMFTDIVSEIDNFLLNLPHK